MFLIDPVKGYAHENDYFLPELIYLWHLKRGHAEVDCVIMLVLNDLFMFPMTVPVSNQTPWMKDNPVFFMERDKGSWVLIM